MKQKSCVIAVLMGFFLILLTNAAAAQRNTAEAVHSMLVNRDFIFIVTAVSPLRGQMRFVNDAYDVTMKHDSLISYLPYFGVAQSAPIGGADGGIKFTSTDFTYKLEARKRKGWDLLIDLKDQTSTQQFIFRVLPNGDATLDVNSTFRDPISYSGYLKKN